MSHTPIPAEAIQAGKSLSRLLLEAMRANILYCDHVDQANTAMLNNSTGHRHEDGATRVLTYTFMDRVKIVLGQNDRIDFNFREGGASSTIGTHAASLTPGTYTLTSLASHVQAQMRSAQGGTTSISVEYQTLGDDAPGHFVLKHTGGTDSPYSRIFRLLCASGTNGPAGGNRSAFPALKFAQGQDRIGNLGYAGDGGFLSGFTQDQFTLGDGGLIGNSGIANDAATAAKIKALIITAAKIKDTATQAVSGGKVQSGAITASKTGQPVQSSSDLALGSGASGNLTFVMPNGSSSRKPRVTVVCTTTSQSDATYGGFQVSAPSYVSGNTWTVGVQNWTGISLTFRGFAY